MSPARALLQQTCLNHPSREAVGRCQECTRTFCRECILEHEGRLLCAECLGRLSAAAVPVPRTWPGTVRSLVLAVLGLLCAWLCFYSLGQTLLTLPSAFHEDTLWKSLGLPFE